MAQRVPASTAAVLLQPIAATAPAASAVPLSTSTSSDPLINLKPTSVLRFLNMVTASDLDDDESFKDLKDDVSEECGAHGTVKSVIIPRPNVDCEGIGEIFVHFSDVEGAVKARNAVSGRVFNGNPVRTTFFPEDLFVMGVLSLPPDYTFSSN